MPNRRSDRCSVEVLQIQCIIQYLIYISFQYFGFANFELKTEDNSIKKQDYVDPLSETGYIIFKNDCTIFACVSR